MKRLLWAWLLVMSGMVQPLANAASDEFPFRVRYPDVSVITTEELGKRFNEVLVIDVRSKYEFDTLHVKDAVNVPLATAFGEKMVQLRAKHNKPFVFYCNGKTCLKSYDAVLLAGKARLDNLYAYDAGIFDWAKTQPEKTALLGRSPIVPANLIDEKSFKARLIEPKDFMARVGDKSVVLDVRDHVQRDSALFPFKEQRAPMDDLKKIDAVIEGVKARKKTLLVYDQTGKQVQWFQYYLENKGVKDCSTAPTGTSPAACMCRGICKSSRFPRTPPRAENWRKPVPKIVSLPAPDLMNIALGLRRLAASIEAGDVEPNMVHVILEDRHGFIYQSGYGEIRDRIGTIGLLSMSIHTLQIAAVESQTFNS